MNKNRGFTLIEVLLVILIIGILAATIAPRLSGRTDQAKIAAAQADIKGSLALALDLYEADNGKYPDALTDLLKTEGKGPYLKDGEIPKDPWVNPYKYQKTDIAYSLKSDGPDKISGTEDDIGK